jgi:hypothetical protein
VLQGWVPELLLDTYEMDRRPIAEHNIARSIDAAGSRRSVVDELQFDLGGRLQHLWMTPPPAASLDLLGPGVARLSSDELSPYLDDQSNVPPITDRRLDRKPQLSSELISPAAYCCDPMVCYGIRYRLPLQTRLIAAALRNAAAGDLSLARR